MLKRKGSGSEELERERSGRPVNAAGRPDEPEAELCEELDPASACAPETLLVALVVVGVGVRRRELERFYAKSSATLYLNHTLEPVYGHMALILLGRGLKQLLPNIPISTHQEFGCSPCTLGLLLRKVLVCPVVNGRVERNNACCTELLGLDKKGIVMK